MATGGVVRVTVALVERRVLRQPWEAITESFDPRGEEEALHVALLEPTRVREVQLRPPTETCSRRRELFEVQSQKIL